MFLVQVHKLSVVRLAPKNEVIVKCINMAGKKYTSRIGTFDTKPKNKNPLSTVYACTMKILNELAHFRPYISNRGEGDHFAHLKSITYCNSLSFFI